MGVSPGGVGVPPGGVGVSPANWLLLMELEGSVGVPPANCVLKKYTWGLDLTGLSEPGAGATGHAGHGGPALQAAGGVGGLLAMEDVQDPNDPNDSVNYVYLYDANGNVGQLIDWAHNPNDPNGAIVGRYEYDPYGNVTAQSGSYAAENPFRFSTKYWDDETGLGYWGQRYYNPALGRWLNRDPLDELGGVNLYAYAGNDPVDRFDPLGQASCTPLYCPGGGQGDDGHRCPKKAAGSNPTSPDRCANLYGPCTVGWTRAPNGACQCGSTELFTYWWEWIPIVATIGHAATPIPGGDIPEHYSLCQPKSKDCKEDSETAVASCEKCVRDEAFNYMLQVLGIPALGKDFLVAGVGLTMDTKAILNLLMKKGGVRLLGGGLVLTADSLTDLGIWLYKLDKIKDAAKEGKKRFCTCAGKGG